MTEDSNEALTPRDEKSGEFVTGDCVAWVVLEMMQCHGKEPKLERGHLETRRSPLNGLVVPVPGRPNVLRADKYWRSRDWGRVVLTIVSPWGGPGEDATMVTSVMAMAQHQAGLLSSFSHSHLSQSTTSWRYRYNVKMYSLPCVDVPHLVAGMSWQNLTMTWGQIAATLHTCDNNIFV